MSVTRALVVPALVAAALALTCGERPAEETGTPAEEAVAPGEEAGMRADRDTAGASATSPYAGWEGRPIKALSPDEVERLLAGEGMGYALAAELNRYPGPRHVLDLADSLALSTAQRDSVEAIRARMNAVAVELGREIVAAEAALDSLFASGAIDSATLRTRTAQIARLEGELRSTHLDAHLSTRAVLDDFQVARYDSLRGYSDARPEPMHDAHQHR